MKLEIRKATTANAKELAAIRNEALAFKLSHGDMAWEEVPFTLQEMLDAVARDTIYLVLADGQPAGSVVLHWDNEYAWGEKGADGKAGYISNLATRDAFRGQNLGAQIIGWATDQTREAGRKAVRLGCPGNNGKLCAYYEKQGFKRIGANDSGEALYERAI